MEKQYSVQFFSSFVEAMQKLCREYLEFDQGVELSGYLAVEIDNFKKERYVLSELIQSTGHVISESYCTKAFKTHRKEANTYGTENRAPQTNRYTSNRMSSPCQTEYSPPSEDRLSGRVYSSNRIRPRQNFSHHRRPTRTSTSVASDSRVNETISLVDDSSPVSQFDDSALSQQHEDDQNRISHNSSFSSQQPALESSSQLSHTVMSSSSMSTTHKRMSSVSDDFTPSKKEKLDASLDALYDAAKDIASSTQSDIDSMSSSYPSKFTRTSVSGSDTITSSADQGGTSSVVVKEEKQDDVPYMVLDDPNVLDPEVHVKSLDKPMFSSEQSNSQTFALDSSTSFSSDVPGSSTSFTGLQETLHSGNTTDGGASWDNQMTSKADANIDMTGDFRFSIKSKKDHICETCNKKFTYNWTLVRHQQSVHQRLLRHTCPLCGKNYNRKDVLAQHLNSHLKSAGHSSFHMSDQFSESSPQLDTAEHPHLTVLDDLPVKKHDEK